MDIDFARFAVWFVIWFAGAVIVVGLIQWAKGLFKTWPGWLWAILMAAVSIGVGFASPGEDPAIWYGLGIWAVAQIGYEAIFQGIRKKIAKATDTESASESPPNP